VNLGVDLPESNVTSFAATGTYVLASTYSGRLFLSTNGGDLWLPVDRGFPNTQIAFIAVNGSYVFANTLAGLYRNLFSDLMSQLPWQEGPSPGQFTLLQNYPNPFNNSTTIRYYLPYATTVSLRLFNPMGQLVTTLVDETQEAGYYSTHVDGAHLASGVYFCQFKAGGEARVKRLVLVK
jgi:sorbitol-specific phosphotransferase system component IIC